MTMKTQPYKNIWESAKALLRGKFITITVILIKRRLISNNLTYNLKELEKEKQTKPKISRRNEIISTREKID